MRTVSLTLLALALATPRSFAQEPNALAWTRATKLGLEGQGWTDLKARYDRLPKQAESKVRPAVWQLSRHSSGLVVRFTSDATAIHVRWTLSNKKLAMPHMPATGVSGLDLYVHDGETWRYCATGKPSRQSNRVRLIHGVAKQTRDYLLYLPLYNGTKTLELGVAKTAALGPSKARAEDKRKPLVFYGTSITQGGCASRTGMVHTAILGRHLNRPVINLGFSGNGKLEMAFAELLGELDAAVFILDCGPNLSSQEITARLLPFVVHLRSKRPTTPILLVEDPSYSNAHMSPQRQQKVDSNRKAMREGFDKLLDKGLTNLHYLAGDSLFPADGSGTVDGTHPTNAGFAHLAKAFEPGLRAILSRDR